MSVHTEFGMSGTGVWRQSAATGHHLAAPTDDEGERENARVEREETWRGFLEQLGNETTTTIMRGGAYNTVHAREETLELEVLSSIGDTANLLVVAR